MITLYRYVAEGVEPPDWDAKYLGDLQSPHSDEWLASQGYVRTILRHIPPGSSVLDAGCGAGGLVRFLFKRGFDVKGIDTSAQAVSMANDLLPERRVQVGSVESPPFENGSFDAYLSIASWEYPEGGPERAAREAARVLRRSGTLVLVLPRLNLLRRILYLPARTAHGLYKRWSGARRRYLAHLFSDGEVRRLLEDNGFEILEIAPHDLNDPGAHYGLYADWPFLRGGPDYRLNAFGRALMTAGNALSPWTIATGVCVAARRRA